AFQRCAMKNATAYTAHAVINTRLLRLQRSRATPRNAAAIIRARASTRLEKRAASGTDQFFAAPALIRRADPRAQQPLRTIGIAACDVRELVHERTLESRRRRKRAHERALEIAVVVQDAAQH